MDIEIRDKKISELYRILDRLDLILKGLSDNYRRGSKPSLEFNKYMDMVVREVYPSKDKG